MGGGKGATTVITSTLDTILSAIFKEIKKVYDSQINPILDPTVKNVIDGFK